MPSRKLGIDCRSSCICVYQVIEEPANYKLLSEEPSRTLQQVEGDTYFDGVSLEKIANEIGTPTYLYSAKSLMEQYRELEAAFRRVDSKIFYSVKANSNVNIISLLKQLNSGFDIVSGGELHRVIAAGGDPRATIFSGVGKSVSEIDLALKVGIDCFNIESAPELDRIIERSRVLGKKPDISVRINPDIDALTHPYISTGLKENKFGVDQVSALQLFKSAQASMYVELVGIDAHIGSQMGSEKPLIDSLLRLLQFAGELEAQGIQLKHLNIGGGFGVPYKDEKIFPLQKFAMAVEKIMNGTGKQLRIEPGRYLTANAGLLLTRVEYLKKDNNGKHFAVTDAAMNDLIRPALYDAWHQVWPVNPQTESLSKDWDIVGPICESADFLAKNRNLSLYEGGLLAVLSAGAYGMSLASNYNSRNRAAEVLIENGNARLIRRRETIEDQLALEIIKE